MNRLGFALAVVALACGTGCVHRSIHSVADHPSAPLTRAVVQVDKNFLVWRSSEVVFYSCAENGDALQCKRLCGGQTDIQCPMVIDNGRGTFTNIR
jgi:hypothetical protein